MKRNRRSAFTLFMWFVFYIALIYVASSIDGHVFPDINKYSMDKAAHFVEYIIFAFLAMRTIAAFFPKMGILTNFCITLVIVVLFSVFDEMHQIFVPGRTCSFYDVAADFLGASTGILIFTYREEAREESRNKKTINLLRRA